MKKLDRRVRRTRHRLRDALITLILEKGYEQVTIQQITDTADLSRATFYLHYKTKGELLANSLEEMFDELMASVKDNILRRRVENEENVAPSLPIFIHVQEYADLYRSLLGDQGISSVINRILDYISRIAEEQYRLLVDDVENLQIPIEVAARHLAGGMLSLLTWWLETDMAQSPTQMAQYFHQLTVPTMYATMGRTPASKSD